MLEMYFDSISCSKINEMKRMFDLQLHGRRALSGRNWGRSNDSS